MYYATKIKMCSGCEDSNKCIEIDSIYLTGSDTNQLYKKATLYDHLKKHPDSIKVKDSFGPYLIPSLSSKDEKYVRSEPNDTTEDNLLKLPRI